MTGINNNTVLMLHCDDFTDSSFNNNNITNTGIEVNESGKFGKSFYCGSVSSNNLKTNISAVGDSWTIDFLLKYTGNTTTQGIFELGDYKVNGILCELNSTLCVYIGGSSMSLIPKTSMITDAFYHIAIINDGTNIKAYLNGSYKASIPSINITGNNFTLFNSNYAPTRSFNGYIDEFRITNEVVWDSDFTPPTEAYIDGPSVNILEKNSQYINFSVSHSNLNKVSVLVNGVLKESFVDGFDSIVFNLDTSDADYKKGDNIITIKTLFNDTMTSDTEITHNIYILNNASLKEVMDEFEKISLSDFLNINVVVLNELPTTVKEGQIVVIGETYNNIVVGYEYPENPNINDIFIPLTEKNQCKFEVGKAKKIETYVFGAWKYDGASWGRVRSYIGLNNKWFPMNEVVLFESGKGLQYEKNFKLKKSWSNRTDSNASAGEITFTNDYIYFTDNLSHMHEANYSRVYQTIDFTDINYVFIDYAVPSRHNAQQYITAGSTTHNITTSSVSRNTIKLDVRNHDGEGNVLFHMGYTSGGSAYASMYIYNIWCE